ncbi:MAG: tetraacyldisaccharide 4'-kinase [Pseudohongiellaceae bacterium]|nr:tetraacyldisaccharide 4'-kinase [Pseudohongiellaceae bacterium]
MSIQNAWYKGSVWLWLLWPLSLLFRSLAARRRRKLEANRVYNPRFAPVIVVGNISVGGTGKTPMVVALVKLLQSKGLKPAVISRGYGGSATRYPIQVSAESSVEEVGDEAVLIRRSIDCPFVVDPKRTRALELLASEGECNIVISDDGLQHYEMDRALEIVVIDGERLLGNEQCLPSGPLREPKSRLSEVDFVILNGGDDSAWQRLNMPLDEAAKASMSLEPSAWVNLCNSERVGLAFLPIAEGEQLHAVAGIGNPQRFFRVARALGYQPLCHPFPDHYMFSANDFCWKQASTVIMTQKDAVKCEHFCNEHYWYLDISAKFSAGFEQRLLQRIEALLK